MRLFKKGEDHLFFFFLILFRNEDFPNFHFLLVVGKHVPGPYSLEARQSGNC